MLNLFKKHKNIKKHVVDPAKIVVLIVFVTIFVVNAVKIVIVVQDVAENYKNVCNACVRILLWNVLKIFFIAV
jgi:hypothetical protein